MASHLLRRTLFGVKKNELDLAESDGMATTLSKILTPVIPADEPIVIDAGDADDPEPVALGEPWVGVYSKYAYNRRNSLKMWWMGQFLKDNYSFQEKMILFLHNHIPIQIDVMSNANHFYEYLEILRRNSFGNLKTMVKELTVCAGMLKYLDGESNTAEAPNENYGRELLELFTLGKGALKAEGDYTTYTELDVQQAARVLTGWRVNNDDWSVYFDESRHDTEEKQFSSALGKTKIANNGAEEYKDLVDLLFSDKDTARYFTRKLYRFFVHSYIDGTIENRVIRPLADILIVNDYEIKPLLEALFSSEHFYDEKIRGGLIKNPVDTTFSLYRVLEAKMNPEGTDYLGKYNAFNLLRYRTKNIGWDLANTPSVAGYEAYYLSPMFHRFFINTVTLSNRQSNNEVIINGSSWNLGEDNGYSQGTDFAALLIPFGAEPDPLEAAQHFSELLLPKPINYAIIGGLADAWANAKIKDLDNPSHDQLKALLLKISQLPEFILS